MLASRSETMVIPDGNIGSRVATTIIAFGRRTSETDTERIVATSVDDGDLDSDDASRGSLFSSKSGAIIGKYIDHFCVGPFSYFVLETSNALDITLVCFSSTVSCLG